MSSSPPPARPPAWVDDDRFDDEPAPPSLVLEKGSLLAGKYRLARTAGFGGMAQLWVATNEATGAEVCIKVLVPEKSDGESVERFRREAYAAARLSHRAIVRIFDLVELDAAGETTTGGKPAALAIVMELLRGETLADMLMKKGKLPLDEAIDLALPFLSALAHAHRAGVVHRDLKPDNIFLATDPDDHIIPKVLDFGVSKMAKGARDIRTGADMKPLTFDGVVLGTPSYMSPEQARGSREVDARSDVFSAGILIYMMIAGKNPFESESFHSVITAILEREPARLASVPDPVWAVIAKALAKDPAARYGDATELGIALRRATGRSSTTESGPQSFPSMPVSAHGRAAIVAPLGGDSIVTVPPVGNAELGDADAHDAPPARTSAPAARQRAIRIVAGIFAVSLVIIVAALFRTPAGSSAVRPAPETNLTAAPSVATPPTATAPIATIIPATVTTAAPSAAPAVPLPDEKPAIDAGAALGRAVGGVPGTAALAKKHETTSGAAAGTLNGAAAAAATGHPAVKREPQIARDPGF